MKYNKIYNLIKNECEEIYFINECENFLEENELNIKDFNENDIIIFSNLTLNYNNVINILNENKIKFYENEDLLNLKYIII
jgi:hypothetical protein